MLSWTVKESTQEWLMRLRLLALLPVDKSYCVGEPSCVLKFMQLASCLHLSGPGCSAGLG